MQYMYLSLGVIGNANCLNVMVWCALLIMQLWCGNACKSCCVSVIVTILSGSEFQSVIVLGKKEYREI